MKIKRNGTFKKFGGTHKILMKIGTKRVIREMQGYPEMLDFQENLEKQNIREIQGYFQIMDCHENLANMTFEKFGRTFGVSGHIS